MLAFSWGFVESGLGFSFSKLVCDEFAGVCDILFDIRLNLTLRSFGGKIDLFCRRFGVSGLTVLFS